MKNKVYKLFAIIICVMLVFSPAPPMPIYAKDDMATDKKTDSAGIDYTQKAFYLWKRLEGDSVAELLGTDSSNPKPIFIVAKNNGTERRYLNSRNHFTRRSEDEDDEDKDRNNVEYYDSTKFTENSIFSETKPFLTKNAAGAFFAKFAGWTEKWPTIPMYSFHYPDSDDRGAGSLVLAPHEDGDAYFWRKETYNSPVYLNWTPKWSITNESKYDAKSGGVKIFRSRDGYDNWISFISEENEPGDDFEMPTFCTRWHNAGGKWSTFDDLEIWVGTKILYNFLDFPYTVQSGQVFNIDDNVIITETGSLTIEKGAAVSVNGQLFNNGKIYNSGTMVIQSKSGISPYDVNGISEIICDGGDIVMLKDSRMYFDNFSRFTMKNGSTLVNSGAFVSEKGMDISDSTWDIRENGSMFLNLTLIDNLSQINTIPMTSGPLYRVYSKDYTDVSYKRLSGMVDYSAGLSYGGKSSYLINMSANSVAVKFGKNVKIINNGYMLFNNCAASLYDDLQYVQRGNGKVEQTLVAKGANASLTYFSDSHPKYRYGFNVDSSNFTYDDWLKVYNEYNASGQFWATYKPK